MRFLILIFATIITGSPALADGLPANPWTHHTAPSSASTVHNADISETPQETNNSIVIETSEKQPALPTWQELFVSQPDTPPDSSKTPVFQPQINIPNITEMLPSAPKVRKNHTPKNQPDTASQVQTEYQKYKRKATDKYNSAKSTASKYYHKAKDSLQNWQKSVKNLGKSLKK